MKSFIAILRKYSVAMVMNFIGLILGFTAFMVLMVQVGYERGFDRNHPTSGRIYRVDKIGIGTDDVFRNILPRGYADDIINDDPAWIFFNKTFLGNEFVAGKYTCSASYY